MSKPSVISPSRRSFLNAGAGIALAPAFRASQAATPQESTRIVAGPGSAGLAGEGYPVTRVWAYDGTVPGPVLRARQGERLRIAVDNRLAEPTTVHWHGIRLPFAMDGVPGLSQPPIAPAGRFVYEFDVPDAGTFWYHPHANSLRQLGRGLAGALIVEEREPVAVDRDLLWVLGDWRLRQDAQIAEDFGHPMEAAMAGRIGNTVTLNGVVSQAEPVRAGERIRLRLVNVALARIMALRFEGHRPWVIAVDGQPCEPYRPAGGRILLGPAMRVDLMLDAEGEPGGRYRVVDDFYRAFAYRLTELAYSREAPVPRRAPEAPIRLPPNPLPPPDLAGAETVDIRLEGGMHGPGMGGMGRMHMGGMGGMAASGDGFAAWSINGMSMTGDGHADMPALRTLALGRSYRLRLINATPWWHPVHLHGHSFLLIARDGVAVPYRQWADTALVAPHESVEVAFVADNPGDWMIHCHVTDHQVSGMMAVLRVA